MKKIEAVIRPFDFESVRDALVEAGIEGMSVSEVKAFDPRNRMTSYRGIAYEVSFEPQYMIECFVRDAQVADIIAAILRSVEVEKCNGTILVLPVLGGIHIRTGKPLQPEPLFRRPSPRQDHGKLRRVL